MKKSVGAIRKILEVDLDLNYRLTVTEFKLESLVVTIGERIVRGSDNAGRIWTIRISLPPPAKELFPLWLMSTWTKGIPNDKPLPQANSQGALKQEPPSFWRMCS